MSEKISILPKEKERTIRWLLLAAPLFFMNTIVLLSEAPKFALFPMLPMLSLLPMLALPIAFCFLMWWLMSTRVSVYEGVIEKGVLPTQQWWLGELVEVSGSTGGFEDDFKDSLSFHFENGEVLKLFVDEYDEASLRHLLTNVKEGAPNARFTYADVISFESRGLLNFLISTMVPDGAIIKMNRSPLAEMVVGFINSNWKTNSFWSIYFASWLAILCALSMRLHAAAAAIQTSIIQYFAPGDGLGQMPQSPLWWLFNLNWSSFSYLITRTCAELLSYFATADLSILAMYWTASALIAMGVALVRIFSPVFVFVDSQSIGRGMTFIRWQNAKTVSLSKTTQFSDPLEGVLSIESDTEPYSLDIDLSQISDTKRKNELLRLVEKYATNAKLSSDFLRTSNALVDIRFTDVWLQANESDTPESLSAEQNSILGTQLAKGAYEVERLLGYGGQGVTYVGHAIAGHGRDRAPTGQVVIKEAVLPNHADVRIQQDAVAAFDHGAELLESMKDPQIVRLWDHFIENGKAYLILEYIEGQTLRAVVNEAGCLPVEQAVSIAKQISEILVYLHSQNPPVVHCDLAPDNLIVMPDGKVKLLDFDVARVLDARRYSFVAGRPSYTPPEQFRGKPCPQSDIYALGAIMHFMVNGRDPAPLGQDESAAMLDGTAPIDALIAKCLSFEPEDRPSSAERLRYELEIIDGTVIDTRVVQEEPICQNPQ